MATIVYQVNKKTGVKYAYESTSYWDKEKKQPRTRRRYLGRVDPETGEIIKAKSRKDSEEKTQEPSSELAALHEEIKRKDQVIADLTADLDRANARYESLAEKARIIRASIAEELADV